MRRRDFIKGIGGSVASWPLCANAQQDGGPRVGFVHNANQDYVDRMAAAFREGLKQKGYVEGQNLNVEYRWADGHNERLNDLISDLLSQRVVALLAAGSNEPARVAKAMTTTIPIVFVSATDPVSQGIVASSEIPTQMRAVDDCGDGLHPSDCGYYNMGDRAHAGPTHAGPERIASNP